jgi:L-alanine-DL-glutamate epimerase-like enolase superfamily enzyme
MSSRIARIETFVAAYPVVGTFKYTSSTTRDTVVVRITDDAGNVGWGQSVPSRTWSYETIETVMTTIARYLGPALVGTDPLDLEAAHETMNRAIAPSFSTGQPICKAGLDLALSDLRGRLGGESVSATWKRSGADRVTLSWTLDPRSLDEVGHEIARAVERGFHHFNVKIGSDASFDMEVCREIRRLAPDAFVWVDANGGYDLETALATAPRFADLGIAAFEQPLPANRLSGYKTLRRQKALPILMDEGVVSLTDLEEFHQLGLLDGVAMKVSRCGGLTESRRMVEYLQENELLFYASGLTDPDIALAASLHLFGAFDLPVPAALNAVQFLEGSILGRPIRIEGYEAFLPSGPGLGVEVREDFGGLVK